MRTLMPFLKKKGDLISELLNNTKKNVIPANAGIQATKDAEVMIS